MVVCCWFPWLQTSFLLLHQACSLLLFNARVILKASNVYFINSRSFWLSRTCCSHTMKERLNKFVVWPRTCSNIFGLCFRIAKSVVLRFVLGCHYDFDKWYLMLCPSLWCQIFVLVFTHQQRFSMPFVSYVLKWYCYYCLHTSSSFATRKLISMWVWLFFCLDPVTGNMSKHLWQAACKAPGLMHHCCCIFCWKLKWSV